MDIFTYKIIYFILALFIGFFAGYMLKKENYEKKVQDEVYEYEKRFQDSAKKLEIIKENFLESENRVEINRDLYNTQKKVIDNIKNNIKSLKQKTISSQELGKDLDIQLENILEDIKKYENIVEKLEPEYQKIASYINENEEIVIKKELLKEELKKNEDKINALKAKSNTLHKELEDLQKLENEYSNINTKLSIKITQIKDKSNIVQNQTNE
jgi:chromosome segregation ATPase